MADSPFTPEQEARFDAAFSEAVSSFPPERSMAALLPALHAAQAELGWLPNPALLYVASRLKLFPTRVREVASFYTLFHLEPVGKNHLQICTNLSCALRGGEDLVARACERLGVKPHQVTPDGKFSVEAVSCLASCGTAPVMQVNDRRYDEKLDPEKLLKLIAELGADGAR